ncbi:3-isopropylmalate dehydratase small subunit [Novosphingobium sp. Gsoil 351]|uniref:3-isopropylmalate dehydratase small subunit n=1 Tax=Novosphingobium sp. Gsoil 351 TaxID=2675225 RepID=UPI0012B4CD4C|nr:3-isopropylmalate dehydratase small subunit [Novosphingobium sp. Gsoil 351]QGN55885.1 3-isopropylmalate dehydratase small subunit [Novosphingobium sp. Gsoil 351]
MEPFTSLRALAAPLPGANIDTDIIVPARFLTITSKQGLGRHAFAEWRLEGNFVLDEPQYEGAQILVAGANFGCGSSREHAAWALADLGIRAIVAPSFGEIFRANALRNGLLPITLGDSEWRRVLAAAKAGDCVAIDLASQQIGLHDETSIAFALSDQERVALLNGWDEIDGIRVRYGTATAEFEARQRAAAPWLWEKDLPHE